MPANSAMQKLATLAACLALFGLGAAAEYGYKSSHGTGKQAAWHRYDFVRDSSWWAFRHGGRTAADRFVSAHELALDECRASKTNGYPCRGRVVIEVFLMHAALEAEAGN